LRANAMGGVCFQEGLRALIGKQVARLKAAATESEAKSTPAGLPDGKNRDAKSAEAPSCFRASRSKRQSEVAMIVIVAAITYWVIRFGVPRLRAWIVAKKTEPAMVALRIPAPSRELAVTVQPPAPATTVVLPDPLCYECVYAHIVRGYGAGEELIACGYAFPMREVLFRVRECSDYRPKRERNRVEIANEGAVCILPLDEKAADFHAVAARRDGEGELESSYD